MSNSDKLLEQIKSICEENKSSYTEWLYDSMMQGNRSIFLCIKIKGGKKKHIYEDSFAIQPTEGELNLRYMKMILKNVGNCS